MYTFLDIFVVLCVSFMAGFTACVALVFMLYKKSMNRLQHNKEAALGKLNKAMMDKFGENGTSEKNLKDIQQLSGTLNRIKEIGDEQMSFYGQIDTPSKNALHSKYKNGLIAKMKELEEEKRKLFRQIYDSGLNPKVGYVKEDGSVVVMTFREMLDQYELLSKFKKEDELLEQQKQKVIQKSKFTIVPGEKDE